MPYYLIFPLAAAIIYALGSMTIKRALKEGLGMRQSFHLTNLVLGLVFVPLLLVKMDEVNWGLLWHPFLMGTTFFFGNWLTFIAIRRGDVSLVTPLMGTKVVFVAIGVVVLMHGMPSPALWLAAILTTVGIFVMGLADIKGGRHIALTISLTLASAMVFGVSDVLVSGWARDFGAMPFLALGTLTVSLWSFVVWLFQGRPALFPRGNGAKWGWYGAFFIAIQALLMGLGLALFADATGVNVVYASRGLWVIVLVVVLGRFLGNNEHHEKGRGFLWRVAGTVLLTVAIVIAVIDRAKLG